MLRPSPNGTPPPLGPVKALVPPNRAERRRQLRSLLSPKETQLILRQSAPTSLVTKNGTNADNSEVVDPGLTPTTSGIPGLKKRPRCPWPVLFMETCGHGNVRPWERPCDKWTCESCCSWRVETELEPELVRALSWARRSGWTLKFITFTWRSVDLAAGTTREAAARRRKDVANFVKWFRRSYGRNSFEYLRVAENHKSGKVHLHLIVVAPYVPQAVLSDQWKINARGAFRVGIEAVGMKCPRCWPGPKASDQEKRASMIVPPPGRGECRRCGYVLDWTGFATDLDVALAASKELGKYLSKAVPTTYLLAKGRRQPISRSKGWLDECGPRPEEREPEAPCTDCGVSHVHEAVGVNHPDRAVLALTVEFGGHSGRCNCWAEVAGPAPPG